MRILLLDQFAGLGGAQLALLDLVPALAQAGWAIHAALPGPGALDKRLWARGVSLHRLSLHNYSSGTKTLRDGVHFMRDLWEVAGEIRALLERLSPALVYVNGPRLMPALAWARPAAPVLFHVHNEPSSGLNLVAAAVRRTGAAVITASRFLAQCWPGATVIYGGVEGPPAPPPRRGGAVGLIGRFAPQKCQKEFARAAALVGPERPFLLCGDALAGDRRAERYKHEVLTSAPDNLRWLGWRDDVYPVLDQLDLLVVPSAREGGVPRVVLEAFAAQVPVLALASGAIPEALVDGENGFLLRSGTAQEIAGRIRQLLADPGRLAAVALRAHSLWRERFTAGRYRSEVLASILQKMAAAKTPAAAVESRAAG